MKGKLTAADIEQLKPIIERLVDEAISAKLEADPRLRDAIRTGRPGRITFREREVTK
jgi:hypothetical protein